MRYHESMRVKLRLILLWVLVLALPFKAMAGVAMFGCGPGHHPLQALHVAASTTSVANLEMDHHGADQGQSPGALEVSSEPASPATTADAGDASDNRLSGKTVQGDGTSSSQPGKTSAGKCGSCAPCCVVAAPACECAVYVGRTASDDGWLDFSDPYVGVVIEVPHQPPRSILG